ncbi:MAG: hypothetical protein K0V04_16130 [Deltaproteobacteria bacterium]|nr:hypothetical protein [Deltaproteobacteria bacterium]
MAFERVRIEEKAASGTQGETPPTTQRRRELLAKTVDQWLRSGLQTVVVERHMGRGGFKPTDIVYEAAEDGVADVEGVTIRGVNPIEFARTAIEDIRGHAEELGAANYRLVGFREGEEGEAVECFRLAIPRHMLGEIPVGDEDPVAEGVGGLLHGYKSLASQALSYNRGLQEWYLKLAGSIPAIADANAKMLLANAEALGKESPAVELELAKLEFERERLRAEAVARLRHNKQERTAEFGKHVVDKLGPDIAAALRLVAMRWAAQQGEPDPDDPTTASEATDEAEPTHRCPLAHRLDAALAGITDDQAQRARAILGEDAWALIETAREAETDEAFRALVEALNAELAQRGEAKVASMFIELMAVVGQSVVAELAFIIQQVDGANAPTKGANPCNRS